ncbi:MAG: DUF262 domain-containing protein [Bacteroides sp.]|nr:DUF262 domain-containing protein [Bacteroides sp.]
MSKDNKKIISGEGDRTSFFKLFVDNDFKIVIPMLQREYAQGRENEKEVRTEFLKALYTYLDEGTPHRDLDFIYGNVSRNEFIPLDGQQRLTTLFLLHWYLSRISPDKELRKRFDDALTDSTGLHCRFTYKTRTTSSDFCDALMLKDLDFDNLLPKEDSAKREGGISTSVKNTIEDKNWFHLSWKHDPTIASMLIMLDAIHELFHARPEFLAELLDTNSPVITFLFMELDKYHLTDDLYIKMNSRGKPLTDFENFKARYSEYIGEMLRKSRSVLTRKRVYADGTEKSYPLDKYFAERIDNAWTNLIWAYRNHKEADKSVDLGLLCDRCMANLIATVLSLKYIETNPLSKGDKDPVFIALANQSGSEHLSFLTLRDGGALTLESAEYLIDILDILSESGERVKSCLSLDFAHCFPIEELMEKVMFKPRELTYNDRVLLFAYFAYLLKYGKNDGINQWMRVVFNLTNAENNRLDSASELSNAIKKVGNLINEAPHILEYLKNGKAMEGFPAWLVEEERIKASIILGDNTGEWLSKILKAEKHPYFTGQIGFILEFAGIRDFFKSQGNYKSFSDPSDEYFNQFMKYSDSAQAVFEGGYEHRFDEDNMFRDKDRVLERAVLFKGDYLPTYKDNNYIFNLLSTSVVRNNVKRDFSWKRVLRVDDDPDNFERRAYLKEVFDDPNFDFKAPQSSLEAVFKGKTTGEQWRDYLIYNPSIIEYCQQGFIAFMDGTNECPGVLPMGSSRLSGFHSELYTMGLYDILLNEEIALNPFEEGPNYQEQKVIDELPFIYFDGYYIDRRRHGLAISAVTSVEDYEWSLKAYQLKFIQKGSRKDSKPLNALNELLLLDGFQPDDEDDKIRIKYIPGDNRKVKSYLTRFFRKLTELKESLK